MKECYTKEGYEDIDGIPGDLVKCDLCKSSTTDVIAEKGYSYPDWVHAEFDYIDDMTLCRKCFDEHIEELKRKDTETGDKNPIIEHMFDGDELKYWRKGDEGCLLGEIEIDCNGGRNRYKKALEEMKKEFQRGAKFIDIDEDYENKVKLC